MKHYRYYDELTGLFYPALIKATDPRDAQAGIPAGHHIIEGAFDHLSQKVDVGKASAEKEAHKAANRDIVESRREKFASLNHGAIVFIEPPEPFFMPTPDVVVDYQPPQPSPEHEWNAEARRWVLSATAGQRQEARVAALARIEHLEREVQPSLLRAVALGQEGAREKLSALDAEVAQLRTAILEDK